MVGWKMPRSNQRINYYNSGHTRIELQAAAAARGLDCWCGRQDRTVVVCAKKGK